MGNQKTHFSKRKSKLDLSDEEDKAAQGSTFIKHQSS